jgi:hypothetical protein
MGLASPSPWNGAGAKTPLSIFSAMYVKARSPSRVARRTLPFVRLLSRKVVVLMVLNPFMSNGVDTVLVHIWDGISGICYAAFYR